MNIKAAAALSAAGVLLTGTAAAAVNANVLNVSNSSPVGNASTVVPSSPETTPTEVVVITDTETALPDPKDSTADEQGQDGSGSTARSTHDSGDDQDEDTTESRSSTRSDECSTVASARRVVSWPYTAPEDAS